MAKWAGGQAAREASGSHEVGQGMQLPPVQPHLQYSRAEAAVLQKALNCNLCASPHALVHLLLLLLWGRCDRCVMV
jgi:hypothetical protein